MKKYSAVFIFALSIILGALIWYLPSFIIGYTEPWDVSGPYYILSLLIAGFIPGFILPRHLWRWALGVVIGQFIAATALAGNPAIGLFGILGPIFMVIWSLLSLFGAGIGFAVRNSLVRRVKQRP